MKEELEKLAPAHVLKSDEVATQGWLVQGSIEKVDAGDGTVRLFSPPLWPGAGRSHTRIHVRVSDLDRHAWIADSKDAGVIGRHGRVIYEFDVAGGSHATGHYGSVTAPADSDATPFDFRNAAERVRTALEVDTHKYGERTSPTIR